MSKPKTIHLERPTAEEDALIDKMIADDPKGYEATAEDFQTFQPLPKVGRPKSLATKESVTMRLSPDVVNYFRSGGKGWQTRLEQVLKEYVQTMQEAG